MEDVIRLTCEYTEVVNKQEVKKKRKYNFEEIRELQSKLTLVAGDKAKENSRIIQQFDQVFGLKIITHSVRTRCGLWFKTVAYVVYLIPWSAGCSPV